MIKKFTVLIILSVLFGFQSACFNKTNIETKPIESSEQSTNDVASKDSEVLSSIEKNVTVESDSSVLIPQIQENEQLNFNLVDFLQNTYPIENAHYELSGDSLDSDSLSVHIVPDTQALVDEFIRVLENQDNSSQLYLQYSDIAYEIIDLPLSITGNYIDSVGVYSKDNRLSHEFIQTYR